MSNYLDGWGQKNQTVYGVRKNSSGQVYNTNTSAFENCSSGNAQYYAIAASEMGGANTTGNYQFVDPAPTTPGSFILTTQAGGSFALSDMNNMFWQRDCIIADLSATPAAGSGAFTVIITVNDGNGNLLQNAIVRVTAGAASYSATTNASGQGVFTINAATWTVAIALTGYTFTQTTLVVNGNTSQTYSMTPITINPPSPGYSMGYLTVIDIANAAFEYILTQLPGSVGFSSIGIDKTVNAVNFFLQQQFIQGAMYAMRREGTNQWHPFTVPYSDSFPLPNMLAKASY